MTASILTRILIRTIPCLKILGPIWTDPMIDEDFLKTALTRVNETPEEEIPTHKRLLGLLTVVIDCVFFPLLLERISPRPNWLVLILLIILFSSSPKRFMMLRSTTVYQQCVI